MAVWLLLEVCKDSYAHLASSWEENASLHGQLAQVVEYLEKWKAIVTGEQGQLNPLWEALKEGKQKEKRLEEQVFVLKDIGAGQF